MKNKRKYTFIMKEIVDDFNYYIIEGYFKDTLELFDNLIVCKEETFVKNDLISEDSVYKFGMTEDKIRTAIRMGDKCKYDFVIRSYFPLITKKIEN